MEIMHFARLVPAMAATQGNQVSLRFRDRTSETWNPITWKDFEREVNEIAKALIEQSLLEKDRVGIFSQNTPEYIVVEYAIYSNRAVSVPLYATSTTSQIEYIINDSGMNVLFVGDQYQYDRAFEAQKLCKGLKQIVIFNTAVRLAVTDTSSLYFNEFMQAGAVSKADAELLDRRNRATNEDMANILYTSGTTGEPKGVIMTHAMFQETIRVHDLKLVTLGENETSVCFLPLSHVFEKAWTHFCLQKNIVIYINENPSDIQRTLKEVQPTCMCNVPRFWEKVYEGIQDKINGLPGLVRVLFDMGVRAGRTHNIYFLRKNKREPFFCRMRYQLYNAIFFQTIRKTVGIKNGNVFPVAGAKLSNDLCLFFRSLGIPIYYGYGLTESTATVAAFDPAGYKIGSVGNLIDGIEVKISKEGEILLKGKTITPGYYRKPLETAESFTEDGFFRTGDAGILDGEHLIMTERIKDLFKTANGKYIAPQVIETALCEDRYIDMVAVVANDKRFVTALIVPAYDQLPEVCKQLGIDFTNRQDVLANEQVYHFFEQRILKTQKHMANYEQIRRFVLLPEPFSIANGDLTDTLKIRRKRVAQHYAEQIASMY
jgi:long-chain acyl-CoA synthetase